MDLPFKRFGSVFLLALLLPWAAVADVTVRPATVPPVLTEVAAKLPVTRLALAGMRNGGTNVKILCIGDSTTTGYGGSTTGTVPAFSAYPVRLASLLGGVPGLANGRKDNTFFDNRWTVPAGYITSQWAWKGYETGTETQPLIFTPDTGNSYDRFDVYYITNPGGGTLTMTATGGAAVGPVSLNAAAGITKTTVSCPANTSASVSIVASGQVWVLGVEPWLSTTPTIRVGNVGVNAWKASDWIASGSFSPLVAVAAHSPHCCIVSLGLNEAAASVTPAAFYADLKTLCVSLKALGSDVVIWIPTPPGPPGVAPVALEPGIRSYLPAYRAVAAEVGCVLVDTYGRHGSAYQAGLSFDGYHSNNLGYWDIAEAIHGALSPVMLPGTAPVALSATTGTFSGALSATTGTFSGLMTANNGLNANNDINLVVNKRLGLGNQSYLLSDGLAGSIGLNAGAIAQSLRVYNTFSARGAGTTSLEAMDFKAVAGANFVIQTLKGSAGGTARGLELRGAGTDTNSVITNGPLALTVTATGQVVIAGTPYANDAAADADGALPSGGLYRLTGSRSLFVKP